MKRPARLRNSKLKVQSAKLKGKTKKIFFHRFIEFFTVIPVILFFTFCAFQFAIPVHAAVGINKQINFQGKLVDNNGLNVADNTYTVVFSLYNVSSGGSATWTETDSVSTLNGVFQVALGANTPFPGNVDFNSDTWYLGIKVGSDLEMTPRIRFSAVPYAFNAAALDGIVATQSATGFNLSGGTSSYSTVAFTTSGSILTMQPGNTGGLTIQSTGAQGLTLNTGGAASINIGASANSITIGNTSASNNTALTLTTGGSGILTLGSNTGTGNVVITPNAGGQAALMVEDLGNGDLFTASAGATTKFAISNAGNIKTVAGAQIQPLTDSTTGVQIANAGGTALLNFDTTNSYIKLGPGISGYSGGVCKGSGANLACANLHIVTTTGNHPVIIENTSGPNMLTLSHDSGGTIYEYTFNNGSVIPADFSLNDGNGNYLYYISQANDFFALGKNNTTPLAPLDVKPSLYSAPVASMSGATGLATLVLDQSGVGDILTASYSGATRFTVNNLGTVTIASGQSYAGAGAVTLSSGGSGGLTLNSASGRVTVATGDFLNTGVSGVTGAAAGDIWYDTSAGKFKINEGGTTKTLCNLTDTGCGTGSAITLQNAYNNGPSVDLSQAAGGLTFGTGIGTQNVTIAPNAGGQAGLVINDQGLGPIFTASASGVTKLVLSHTGNLGVGSSSPQQALTLGSSSNFVTEMAAPSGVTATLTNTGSNALSNGNYFYKITAYDGVGETTGSTETSVCTSASNQHTCALSWGSVTGAISYKIYRTSTSGSYTGTNLLTTVTTTSYADDGSIPSLSAGTPPSSTTAYLNKVSSSGASWLLGGKLGLGTTSPLARLHINGGETGGNAAAIIDQIGAATNDILTGSASGTTKFSVANSGAIKVAGSQSSDIDTLSNTATLTIGGTSQNGLTLGRSGSTTTINGSGLAIGATSWTATPTISGLITASSGVSVAAGQSYTGAGAVTLTSASGQTLTIDSGTTGALNIGTGNNGKTITIGNTTANTALVFSSGGTGNITLGSNNGTGTVVVQPNAGGQAGLIVNKQFNTGDLFTASVSGATKFIVHNDGSIQVLGSATADLTTITGGNSLTIQPKTNASGAGGTLTLKSGNGTGGAGGGLVLDAGTGSTNGTISIGTTNQSGLTLGRSGATTTINGSSLTFGAATGVSGTFTITSNSASALTVGANGSTNPVFTVNASTGSVATGLQVLGAATGGTTALSVTDSGSNANLSIDAKGSGTIAIGTSSSGNITLGGGSGASTIIIGGSTNGLTFSTSAGPSYAGSGRPTKQIVLSAEYAGAVLTASGSAAISGSMTSDASPSAVTTTTNNYENYYQWAATSAGSDQQYTIAVRVTLPKDFSDWASGNAITVDFNTPFTNSALNSLDVFIYKGGDTSGKPVAFSKANVSGTSKNWAQVSFTKAQLTTVTPTLTASGQEAVFYLTLHSTNTVNYVQVGDITLNYLAAF